MAHFVDCIQMHGQKGLTQILFCAEVPEELGPNHSAVEEDKCEDKEADGHRRGRLHQHPHNILQVPENPACVPIGHELVRCCLSLADCYSPRREHS